MNLEKKFTPGPWVYQKESDDYTHIVRPSGNLGQIICSTRQDTSGVSESNANLIAAAPELLEALENIENDDNHMPESEWMLIQNAIAKAYGEKP